MKTQFMENMPEIVKTNTKQMQKQFTMMTMGMGKMSEQSICALRYNSKVCRGSKKNMLKGKNLLP